jgi:sodium/potassium/calcium exchanger 6
VLGSTADAYLSPVLASISKHLRLSQSLAGVTLLAFGNGAPDVFSSISAASSIDSAEAASLGSGFYLAASSSIGGGFFVSQVISSAIVLLTKPKNELQTSLILGETPKIARDGGITVNPNSFIRDIVFYLITIGILLYAMFVKERFDLTLSIFFLCIYGL